jgi:cytochrome oxidase assembly protein ShyY1
MHRKLFLSLFFIPIIILGIILSIWQYQRSIWKENILAEYHHKLSQPYGLLPTVVIRAKGDKNSIIGTNNSLFKPFELMPVKLTGYFLSDLIFYRPTHDGLDLIVAFKTSEGIIPVNAGTMPHNAKDLPLNKILPSQKEITIYGFYRIPESYGNTLPKHKALVAKIPFAVFYKKFSTEALVGALQTDDTFRISNYLTGKNREYFIKNIPNNHLQYMGTWFLLSMIACIIYIILLRKTPD